MKGLTTIITLLSLVLNSSSAFATRKKRNRKKQREARILNKATELNIINKSQRPQALAKIRELSENTFVMGCSVLMGLPLALGEKASYDPFLDPEENFLLNFMKGHSWGESSDAYSEQVGNEMPIMMFFGGIGLIILILQQIFMPEPL